MGHREGDVAIGEAAALGCSLLAALTLLEAWREWSPLLHCPGAL